MGGQRTGFFVGVAGLLASFAFACDDLALPQAPDGGVAPVPTNGTSGGPVTELPLPSYAPAGAIKGEVRDILSSRLATWVTLGQDGKVATVGWNFPLSMATALEGAAADSRLFLNLPPEAARDTTFGSMSHGFMPAGHIPNGVYNTPHFDYHIGYVDAPSFKAIDCSDPTLPKQAIIPQGWGIIPPPDNCVTAMGVHAINFMAPEFNGQRFSISAVLLYYRGAAEAAAGKGAVPYGWEPKFTSQVVKDRKGWTQDIPVSPPGTFGRASKQPTKMIHTYVPAEDAYVVEVSGWVDAS